MCTSPLKGFKDNRGRVVKVCLPRVEAVVFDADKGYISCPAGTDGCFTDYIDIPCRACEECYNQTRKEWISRAVAESMCHDSMVFVTLTYNDESLPVASSVDNDGVILEHSSLNYSDFQLFMKRLRKFYYGKQLRFMVCGEYGSHTFRPHYHAIIYGLSLDDLSGLKLYKANSHGDYLYSCDSLADLWKLGYVVVSGANIATIGYVAGYVAKKSAVIKSKQFYSVTGCVPPFIRSSNRPGLGRPWFDMHMHDFDSIYDYKSVPTDSEPFKLRMPQSWKKVYEREQIYKKYLDEGLISDLEHDMLYEDKTDYFKNKVERRVNLLDSGSCLLATDMSKEDYNNSRKLNFRNSCKRKRGEY